MTDTPESLAAELRTAKYEVGAIGARLVQTQSTFADLADRIEALPDVTDSWTPEFPGDAQPGTIRWGACASTGKLDNVEGHEAESGATMGVVRYFSSLSRADKIVAHCTENADKGRVTWASTKMGTSWANVAMGKADAALLDLFRRLAEVDGPVVFTAHHEPEGGNGTPYPDEGQGSDKHWRAMQVHVGRLLRSVGATNIAFAPVLMAWTYDPRSSRNPEDWWTDDAGWDFLGIDVYQSKESGPAPIEQDVWLHTLAFAERKGVRIGIAEWGNRGTDDATAHEMQETYHHLIDVGVPFACYFDTHLNSGRTPYTLTGAPLDEFRRLMALPSSAVLGS